MRFAAGIAAVVVCSSVFAAEPVQRTLSFEDRVKAQAAIERVYYSHQLGATKTFDDAVPKAVLEAKVHKYLDESAALNTYWKTAVTDQSLQRELERMAQGTKMPERLVELYAALGNDPFLAKECLARPALVDRLTHNFYAFDPTMHVKARGQAVALHQLLVSGELKPTTDHPNRTVTELVVSDADSGPAPVEQPLQRRLKTDEFQKKRAELPKLTGQISEIKESREAFAFSVVLLETSTSARVASYVVPKTAWDAWWETARRTTSGDRVPAVASGNVGLPVARQVSPGSPNTTCADDAWDNGSLDALPRGTEWHSAVWTGSVMVVWGGADRYFGDHYEGFNSGSRYDPATDTFTPTSTVGAPTPRVKHTAVWTGSQMIVWGGLDNSNFYLKSGGRYDPITDTWLATSVVDAPRGRYFHTAVWTGSEMIVWGGDPGGAPYSLNSGGRYNPTSDTWTATSTNGAPSARSLHTAVWTGTEMVIWGAGDSAPYTPDTGGRYDPATDSWTPTSTIGAPLWRIEHSAVWTGHVMVVWGGIDGGNTGGRYDPASDTWAKVSLVDAPAPGNAGGGQSAVWTGSQMIIWGMYDTNGSHNSGGRYDPVADIWQATSLVGAPSGRAFHTAIWSGSSMIVWGGLTYDANTGGRYDPVTDTWTPTTTAGAPVTRFDQTAVWTGTTMIVWGGDYYDSSIHSVGTGGRYDPGTDTWTPTTTSDAPLGRRYHSAIWTGSKMIVWGGDTFDSDVTPRNTGGSYDPIADHWTATSTIDAPRPRESHTAVWTGTTMVVWGGHSWLDEPQELNTGGRYDPITDTWTATSLVAAPSRRVGHSAIWTGGKMVIWGGSGVEFSDHLLRTGGQYDPSSDTWTGTSLDGAPSGISAHTAVWTGSEMIVWAGIGSGGRYSPEPDTWTEIELGNAPSYRESHSAIWTGSEMIIWGGRVNTGGRYSPATNSWRAMTTVAAPLPRAGHSAVWTGNMMVVWGGGFNTGGRYFLGSLVDDDCDNDGFTESAGDCNDHNASVYPEAPQICDGLNDDCFDPNWPAVPYNEADLDHDGVSTCDGDCYDNDPTVYPDAEQLCDGINNDCNDPSWPNPAPDESDSDFDGWRICAGDCDDTNWYRNPGRPEICDGIDNNCDVVVDNGGNALCNDSNICTDEVCGGTSGCHVTSNTKACSDGDACTSGDICGGGNCHSGTPTICDDSNPCTSNSCDHATGHCVFVDDACNDHNPCTNDTCDPGTSNCSYTFNTDSCDDGEICTVADRCTMGSCLGAPRDCDDGNTCDGTELCYPGYGCYSGEPLQCNDGNVCTADSCNPATGCVHTAAAGPCNDANACTSGDTCGAGVCTGATVVCNDNNACTSDTCNPASGCVFANDGGSCDDHNPCTDDSCIPATGACGHINNDSNACSDGDSCTQTDSCRSGTCSGSNPVDCSGSCPTGFTPDGEFCRKTYDIDSSLLDNQDFWCDGTGSNHYNSCNGLAYGFHWSDVGSTLAAVTRVDVQFESGLNCGGTSSSLTLNGAPAGTFELVGSCDCVPVHGTISMPGIVAGTYVKAGLNSISITPDSDCGGLSKGQTLGNSFARITVTYLRYSTVCQVGTCNPGTGACEFSTAPDGTDCTDGNPCTTGDTCGSGACAGAPLDCNDNNPCTDDSCDLATGCSHLNNTAGCNDGNACTVGDTCGGGTCIGGAPSVCNDGNACNGIESCNPTSGCVAGTPLACNDNNPCTTDSCNAVTGCVVTNNTNSCSDGNACTTGDVCGGGTCHSGAPLSCADTNPCTSDSCNPATGCVFTNNTNSCSDGNACTTGDVCGGGSCIGGAPRVCNDGNACNGVESCNPTSGCVAGTPLTCNDNNTCTTDTCNSATGCVFLNNTNTCNDGNACTTGDVCGGGSCHGATLTCNDTNPCTDDTCNAASGCVFTNNTNACSDGNACTRTDVCSNGACVGGNPVVCGAPDQCHTAGVCTPATGVCSNTIMPNGTICDDASLCTTGETCQSGTCTPSRSGLDHPRPRSSGYYRLLCERREHDHHWYQGDQLTDADAACVGQLTSTFAGITTVDEVCDVMDSDRRPPHGGRHHGGPGDGPNGRDCDKGENELIATALNICRARVCEEQSLDSHCHGNSHTTVSQSFADADAILDDPARDRYTCKSATCELREINNGHALEMNSLMLSMDNHKVRLTWSSPVLDDGSGAPASYELWRRPMGSDDAFVKIGTTTGLTFVDVTGGTTTWEYDITAVIPGD